MSIDRRLKRPAWLKIQTQISNKKQQILLRGTVIALNYALGGRISKPIKNQTTTLKYSGLAGSNGHIDIQRTYRDWESSERLWNEGQYAKACEMQSRCLTNIVNSHQLSNEFTPPHFMSVGWTAAIGHLGFLGIFHFAQQLGITPSNKRFVSVKNNRELKNVKQLFPDVFTPLPYTHSFSILENPSQWHLSERLSIIRCEGRNLPLYELTEEVFNHPNYQPSKHRLILPEIYSFRSREILGTLGLPESAWFVGLHVREKPNGLDARNANIETYIPAIKEVTKSGGWVIRFGTGQMTPLPKIGNVIDLCPESENFTEIHQYLLANAKFIIITTSGPAELAKSFGTKILGTNTTSIGRNILSATPGSLYLPKKWEKDGRAASYAELVSSNEGYAETDLRTKFKEGYRVVDNSSEEIRLATREMLGTEHFSTLNESKISDLRDELKAIGKGKFANSYLESNKDWFLKS